MVDIEAARPYLCYPFGVAETLDQKHGIHSLTQLIEERSTTFDAPVIGMPVKDKSGLWKCEMYTYKDILNGINALCHYYLDKKILRQRLNSDGLESMTVALIMPSNVDMMMNMLAMQRLGLGVLLITPHQTVRVFKHLCAEVSALNVVTTLEIDGVATHAPAPSSIWKEAMLHPGKSYARTLSPEQEGDTIGVVYHTSGTTSGLPKPLPTKHKFLVSFCAHKFTELATLTTTPVHTGGNADICRSMCANAPLFLFPDSVPLTCLHVIEARDSSSRALGREVRALSCVPYVAKMLAENEASLKMLQRLQFLGVGGAPLPKATGDFIVNSGVPLVSRMGSSECNFLMCSYRDYDDDKDWDYLRSEPGGHHFKFLPQDNGSGNCELEVSGSWPALAVATNHDGNFRTGDLFQPHPTTPHAWLYLGRNDDTIVLGNGKKADPRTLEDALRGLKYTDNALVFGNGKDNIGVLVIESSDSNAPKGDDLRSRIWEEVVRDINSKSPSHAEVYQEMIIVLPSSKDFEKTPKGTIFRNGSYAKFEREINDAYKQTHESVDIPDDKLEQYIHDLVVRVAEKQKLTCEQDLFEAGVNSLQSVRIRNIMNGELGLDLPTNIVYEEPSISSLTSYVRRVRAGEAADAIDNHLLMKQLVERYKYTKSQGRAETFNHKVNGVDATGEVVLLTGATGGLASHLLKLFSTMQAKIKKVICLIRSLKDADPLTRVQEALQYRQISLDDKLVQIEYWESDLKKLDLGLGSKYQILQKEVTLVVHAAWPVNFNASLSSFESSIASTTNLINLALSSHRTCRFYFCSSTASIINHPDQPIPEIMPEDPGSASTVGYAQSKWVTEHIVASYAEVLSVGILRIGQLCGDTVNGVWSESEGWSLMFASVNVLGTMPELKEDRIAWLPVDLAASTIVDIVLSSHKSGQIWHIVNPGVGTSWSDMLVFFKHAGWKFDVVPARTWVRELEKSEEGPDNPSRKLLSLWRTSFDNDVELKSDPVFDTTRATAASTTLRDTKAVDEKLMTKIFNTWKNKGFLI